MQSFANLNRSLDNQGKEARGAATIEIALTCIVFITFVCGLIWVGFALNARTALNVSMGDALRFGVTRALSPGAMLRVGQAIDGASWSPDVAHANIEKLLYWNSPGAIEPDVFSSLTVRRFVFPDSDFDSSWVDNDSWVEFTAGSTSNLTRPYLYTLIAMHQYMRNRVGKRFLRYPCNDKPGCLGCRFIRPDAVTSKTDVYGGAAYIPTSVTNIVAMRCTYNIDFGLANILFSSGHSSGYDGPQVERTFYVYHGRDA